MSISLGKPAAALLCAAALTGLSACSATLNTEPLTEEIQSKVKEISGEDLETSVDCPSGVTAEAGSTFECTATIDGQELTIEVTQTNDDGDLTYDQAQAVLSMQKAEDQISAGLVEQIGGQWTVSCAPDGHETIYISAVNDVWQCQAEGVNGDGQQLQAPIQVTTTSLDGGIAWEG